MNTCKVLAIAATWAAVGIAVAGDEPKAVLQTVMLTKINPPALAIWDITNNAMDGKGNVDAKKLTADQWAKLIEYGKALEAGGRELAKSNGIVAAPPDATLQDQTATSGRAQDVQKYLDAKPALFRSRAQKLQQAGAKVVAAVTKRDAKAIDEVARDLDGVCEACHVDFWYPDQKRK